MQTLKQNFSVQVKNYPKKALLRTEAMKRSKQGIDRGDCPEGQTPPKVGTTFIWDTSHELSAVEPNALWTAIV